MSNELILHYGMKKTGSASIQASLYRHLKDSNFHYVDLGNYNSSIHLANAFKRKPEERGLNKIMQITKAELSSIRDQVISKINENIISAKGKTIILSAEILPNFKLKELAELIELIKSHGLSITAVGYIRTPQSYMESLLQQRIKGGRGG